MLGAAVPEPGEPLGTMTRYGPLAAPNQSFNSPVLGRATRCSAQECSLLLPLSSTIRTYERAIICIHSHVRALLADARLQSLQDSPVHGLAKQ